MNRSRRATLSMLIVLPIAAIVSLPLIGQSLPAEPQIEPPPAEELSPEIPPTAKPVAGEGSMSENEAPEPAAAGQQTDEADAAAGTEEAAATVEIDTIALFYLKRCSGCHTIGRGDLNGPDLLPATSWPRQDLTTAVRRMEKNVGPMTDEQIEGLVDLLEDDDLQQRLDDAASRRVSEMAAALDPGSPQMGERLFFGATSFQNGAVACFACHAVASRGGNMAVDLTMAHERLGQASLLSAAQEPSFPMMKAAYAGRPVTAQEAVHIVAFLDAVAAEAKAAGVETAPRAEPVQALHGVAGGLVLLSLGSIVFAVRSRRAGSRSRLVRESFRR